MNLDNDKQEKEKNGMQIGVGYNRDSVHDRSSATKSSDTTHGKCSQKQIKECKDMGNIDYQYIVTEYF